MDVDNDVKKLTEFINSQKSSFGTNYEFEFQDFVNFGSGPDSDQEEDDAEEIETEIKVSFRDESLDLGDLSNVVLTSYERSQIDTCTDPDLKRLMVLNRMKNMQLLQLLKKVNGLIETCEDTLEDKSRTLKKLGETKIPSGVNTWRLAAPFFKDRKFFQSPQNVDAIKKRTRNELSPYEVLTSRIWTPVEFDRLSNAVRVNYNLNRRHEVVKMLNAAKARHDIDGEDLEEEITRLESKLEHMERDEIIPVLNDDDCVNWSKIAEVFLNDKHTAVECRAVWHLIIHPDINRSNWTDEENKKLETLVAKYDRCNWEAIAEELKTNRSSFMTCIHYFSKLNFKYKRAKFTEQEDQLLKELVDMHKSGNTIPWNRIVLHFENRSRHQVYHRYTYFLSQNHVKKGKFTEAEDILLMLLVNKFGKNFRKCAEHLPQRSQMQLKSRYNTNLQQQIKKGTFTTEDDRMILDYVTKHGEHKWQGLTVRMNRGRSQLRRRYKIISDYLKANPRAGVESIPKRKHNFVENNVQYKYLQYMVKQFERTNTLPALSDVEQALRSHAKADDLAASHRSEVKNLDSMIVDLFREHKKMQSKNGQESNTNRFELDEAARNTESVLNALSARLDIPDDFECNPYLDAVDVEILKRLRTKSTPSHNGIKLLLPNFSTAVGLRTLIIKHKDYKIEQKHTSEAIKWEIDHLTENMDAALRMEAIEHREMFSGRFFAVFNWTAALSLEKPAQCEETISRESMTSPPPKKRKVYVTNLKIGASKAPVLVEKSVLDQLASRNASMRIVRIDNIAGPDGVVQSVIDNNLSSKHNQSAIETMQQNGECDTIEIKAIANDVARLNEILNLEKVKMSSQSSSDQNL